MKSSQRVCKYFSLLFIGFNLLMVSFFAFGQDNSQPGTQSKNPSTFDSANQTFKDSTITTKIKAKLLKSSLLSAFDIKITTDNGIVKLSGHVDSDAQYEQAIIFAENTDGVKDVDTSGLRVESSQKPLADTLITAKVKGLLVKNSLVGTENLSEAWSIHVETKDGVVYLTGKVKNSSQIKQAIQTAKSVKDVKSVKSGLTI